jgi:copper chaperone NosL
MKNKIVALSVIIVSALWSCSVEPEQINYGTDMCSFCKMTIVDRTHAAQFVTKKGKQFKFDAIECMVNHIGEKGSDDIGLILVTDYEHPGTMVSAVSSTYLICKEIKSPMGADLSGFADMGTAVAVKEQQGGTLYTWNELLQKFDA